MNRQQILEKAIQKAIDGGWKNIRYAKPTVEELVDTEAYYGCIFNHQFAKALWGEEHIKRTLAKNVDWIDTQPAWRMHLQQMVIADDPIQYLGNNL